MKVMIVDDSNLLQARLTNALIKSDENMSISRASNCKEAADLFSQIEPDTVILDIALPDGSGIELLRTMKKENPQIAVFMFTNYGSTEFKKSCLELGAENFFEKSNMKGLIDSLRLQHAN